MRVLASQDEWRVIIDIFRARLASDYDQEKVIKGITSLALSQVEGHDDFWHDVFEIIDKKIAPELIDAYLKMNLLWTMARKTDKMHPTILESLLAKVA